MKTKKWITIGLISLLVLIVSVVLLFVLVLPGIKKNKAMKALEEGNKVESAKLFGEMKEDQREDYKDSIKDLVVYKANQCLKNEITYDEFYKVMDAVEEIYTFNGMTEDAFLAVNGPKVKQLYADAVAEYKKNQHSDAFQKLQDQFQNLMDANWNNQGSLVYNFDDYKEFRNKLTAPVEEEMQAKYDAYNAGTLDYEETMAYVETASYLWYSEKAYNIQSELHYDKVFKEELDKAKEKFDQEEYWSTMSYIDNTRSWYGDEKAYSKWKSQFDTLYEEAENKAKTYYVEKAIEEAKAGNTYMVEEIINDLKAHFGEDFDVSAIEQNMHEEWQKAYVEFFAGDWKADLKKEIERIDEGNDFFGLKSLDLDKDLPNKMFLKDLDGDGVPEVLVADSKYMIIITYYNSRVITAGMLQWIGMGDGGIIVSAGKMVYQGIDISLNLVVKLKNGKLENQKMTTTGSKDGQVIYGVAEGNGELEQVEEDAYNAAVEAVKAEIKTTALTGGANLADYEKYIYSYKAE